MSILFLEKTIPLNIGVVTNLEKVINDLAAPMLSATVEFNEVTTKEVKVSAIIDAYNPNSFDILIEDITGEIITETGEKVGDLEIDGGILPAKDSLEINTTGNMLLEAFNYELLFFNIKGIAGAKIAGFEKNISFDIETNVIVPDLEKLILSKDEPVLLSIKADTKLTLKGLATDVILEINNTYKVDLTIRDIICKIYTIANDKTNLLGEKIVDEDLIAETGLTGTVLTEITIPFSKLLTIDPFFDWLMISVTGRITIKGIDQSIFIEVRGYTDFHIFR